MAITTNLKEAAYEHIKKMILDNQFEYDVVYSERKTSTDIGVSRTPFHSALQQLEQEGYLDILPSRGFTLHKMSERDVEETFEIRSAIEFFCIYTLTEDYQKQTEASLSTVQQLKDLLEKQQEIFASTACIEDFVIYDFDFHATIVAYKGNAAFDEIYRAHTYKIKNLACRSLTHPGRMEQTLQEHAAILKAVIHGDLTNLCEITMHHFNTPKYINLQDIM